MMVLSVRVAQTPQAPPVVNVYVRGDGGFDTIRIPSLVVSNRGVLLAFAEGRQNSKSDQAGNRIVLRRSRDSGRTWQPLQVLAGDGKASLNNPCAVVERRSGRILLMFQSIPEGVAESSPRIPTGYEGKALVSSFLMSSGDDGKTWSKPADITRFVKHPTGATTICSGPGIGIQLTRGPHRGRLIMPFNEGPFWLWNVFAAISDDGGTTWRAGRNAPGALVQTPAGDRSQVNEVQMAETSSGSIVLDSRQFAGAKVRKFAESRDGGETWSTIRDAPDLPDPSCMGSILRFSFGAGRDNVLLHSGPDARDRRNGTLYASFDDGATWRAKVVIDPGEFAYNVLAKLKDGSIGCLYETDGYKRIVFARLPNAADRLRDQVFHR